MRHERASWPAGSGGGRDPCSKRTSPRATLPVATSYVVVARTYRSRATTASACIGMERFSGHVRRNSVGDHRMGQGPTSAGSLTAALSAVAKAHHPRYGVSREAARRVVAAEHRHLGRDRGVKRSDHREGGPLLASAEEDAGPCRVERELGQVEGPGGRGRGVGPPSGDSDSGVQRGPDRPERRGRWGPIGLVQADVGARGAAWAETTETGGSQDRQNGEGETT
jgi:hypothetical protein